MRDIDNLKTRPEKKDFENTVFLAQENSRLDSINAIKNVLNSSLDSIDISLSKVMQEHENAKESYTNWLNARASTGSSNQNKEVLERAAELDLYLLVENRISKSKDSVRLLINKEKEAANAITNQLAENKISVNKLYKKAIDTFTIQAFLIRLAIVFPILLLAIFFVIKKRKHKYWSLFFGFILFALYILFFGLVPYLPSYGGYIRYSVGVLLCLGIGIYIINKIRSFIEAKQKELKISQTDRAKNVQLETAEKALEDHICPSCGKGFVIKSWKKLPGKQNKVQGVLFTTNYCRFCGLVLFKDCSNCGTENFVHLPFCLKCGDSINSKKEQIISKP